MKKNVILFVVALLALTACSVFYTNFSFQMRECIPDDTYSFKVNEGEIRVIQPINYSGVSFEKQGERIKIYYRQASPCKLFDVKIGNLSRGEYVFEEYHIKYEDVGFFELTSTKNVSVK